VAVFGRALGLTNQLLSDIGAWLMIAFGVILLVAPLSRLFERALASFSASADQKITQQSGGGLRGQFIGGLLLGAVWSPCIGPTLGGAIALASSGENLLWAFLIMVAFATGVASLIIGIAWGGQNLIRTRAHRLRGVAEKSKPIMGAVFIAVGLMILLRINHKFEIWAIQNLPYWFQDLSIAI